MSNNKIYTQAFSLVELLITLVIVTSILLFTLSSLQSIVSKNRAVIYTNELITALQFTRYAAINLGEPIIFCGSKDHKTCQGSWHNGSIVITATSGKILRIFPEIFAGDKLSWQGSFGRQNTITFLPTGFPNGLQGSFYYCPQNNPENALAIILNSTGRARIANKTAEGKTIPCNF